MIINVRTKGRLLLICISHSFKPGFHIAVRCRKAAAGIAGTIAAAISTYMETISPGTAGSRNHHSYGTVMTWKKLNHFQLCSILPASSAMKIYMETGCLRQPPANHCLSLFYLSLSSLYPLVTGIVTGI